MRTISTQEAKILRSQISVPHARVQVKDSGGTYRDWTALLPTSEDFVVSIEWGDHIDAPGPDASVDIAWRRMDDNASPYVTGSRLEGYLDLGRDIKIETALMPPDVTPSAWDLMFEGTIDEFDLSKIPVGSITARGKLSAELQDSWIQAEEEYGTDGGRDMEDVIQDILTDHAPSAPTLYTPSSPSFAIVSYNQTPRPIMDAIKDIAFVIGWDVRERYRESSGAFELTLVDPDRTNTTSSWDFTADEVRSIRRLGIKLQDIRTVVSLWYLDGGTDESGTPTRAQVVRPAGTPPSSSAITAYGVRWMEVAEGSASLIDTQAEAEALADAILSDLQDPTMDVEVEIPYFWPVQLYDVIQLPADPGGRFDTATKFAVQGFRHRISESGDAVTTLQLTGKPRSARFAWLDREARPGQADTHVQRTPDAPTVTLTENTLHTGLDFSKPIDGTYREVEIHRSESSGFTPSTSTLMNVSRSTRFQDMRTTPGTTYYYQVAVRDDHGNRSSYSSEVSGAAARLTHEHLPAIASHACKAIMGSDQTVGTSGGTVPWTGVDFGADLFDNAADSITVDYAGIYRISVRLAAVSDYSGGTSPQWSFRVTDGTTDYLESQSLDAAAEWEDHYSVLVYLEADTELTVEVDVTGSPSSGDLTWYSSYCYFLVEGTNIQQDPEETVWGLTEAERDAMYGAFRLGPGNDVAFTGGLQLAADTETVRWIKDMGHNALMWDEGGTPTYDATNKAIDLGALNEWIVSDNQAQGTTEQEYWADLHKDVDWALSFEVYLNSLPATNATYTLCATTYITTADGILINVVDTGGAITLEYEQGKLGSGSQLSLSHSWSPSTATWYTISAYHVSGGDTYLCLDGSAVANGTPSGYGTGNAFGGMRIGADVAGANDADIKIRGWRAQDTTTEATPVATIESWVAETA